MYIYNIYTYIYIFIFTYFTRSHKHRASCSAGPCVQQITPAHGEQGSTQQSTSQSRQSSVVAAADFLASTGKH